MVFGNKLRNLFVFIRKGLVNMTNANETSRKILAHFDSKGWKIPDVAVALNITEQYLRKILNNPCDHLKQLTDIISYYKIR